MTRLILFFLVFFSAIPSLWAHHYQVFMPILLNPAENNPYLDRHHMNSVYSRGFHFHFDDFYEGATTPKMQTPLQGVFPYFCVAPQKDGISLTREVSTIPIRSYSRDESLLTKKQTVSGFLDHKPIQAIVNLAFFGWDDWLPSFRHNAGFACSYARNDEEYWYSRDKITKDDTISLRIQYPVGTEISLPHWSFRILSNFSHQNTDQKRVIRLGKWIFFSLFPSDFVLQSLVIERLDGARIDGKYVLEASHRDDESIPLPADTAVLHLTLSHK